MNLIIINGSPRDDGRTASLCEALGNLEAGARLVHVGSLNASTLLMRDGLDRLGEELGAISDADVVAVVTPIYRDTYSGLLKCLFDLMNHDALLGKRVILGATAGNDVHKRRSAEDLGRLVESVGGVPVGEVVFTTASDFEGGEPTEETLNLLRANLKLAQG